MDRYDLSLILPVHNEAEILDGVYDHIYKHLKTLKIRFECLLVENGSTDGSWDTVRRLSAKYPHTRAVRAPKGYGSAVLAALKIAGGRYISYMPSDGQIDMTVFGDLWNLAAADRWEIVKIRRLNRESIVRHFTTWCYTLIMHLRFGTPFVDINGGPRILSRRNILSLKLKDTQSFIDAEMLIQATERGWKIRQVPMRHLNRAGGKSTRSFATYAEFIRNIITYRIPPR